MLPPEFKLGGTDVTCEGWENDADPYILKGSCGVEYRLILSEMGQKKFDNGEKVSYDQGWRSEGPGADSGDTGDVLSRRRSGGTLDRLMSGLFWLAFVAVLCYAAYSHWNSRGRRGGGARRGGRGGGGGYDGDDRPDDPNDPPPAYQPPRTPKSEYASSPKKTRASPRSGGGQSGNSGFLSGAATGGAAGAAAGWFAGRRSMGTQGGNRDRGEGSSQSPPSGPSSSYSSDRYESTGFGGTRNR